MTKLEKIEQQISELSPADRKKLLEWLAEQQASAWNCQNGDDRMASRLQLLRELKGAGAPRSIEEIDALIRHIRGDA